MDCNIPLAASASQALQPNPTCDHIGWLAFSKQYNTLLFRHAKVVLFCTLKQFAGVSVVHGTSRGLLKECQKAFANESAR